MKSYKIILKHHGHICYECRREISLLCPAVKDLHLFGHIVGQKAYFHPQCYRETRLTPNDYVEFDERLKNVSL